MTIQEMDRLDVREKRGNFLVLTESGGAYFITARKNVAGEVTLRGGTLRLQAQEVCIGLQPGYIREPIIEVGEPIATTTRIPAGRTLRTSPVVAIYRIDNEHNPEVAKLITAHLDTADHASIF